MDFVVASKRVSINSGMVVIPDRIYLGSKNKAPRIIAIAARVSHAITKIPSLKALPLSPTICSADKLVNSKDPAMVMAPKLLPPKKYPSADFSSVFRVAYQAINATNKVNPKKESVVIIVVNLWLLI